MELKVEEMKKEERFQNWVCAEGGPTSAAEQRA